MAVITSYRVKYECDLESEMNLSWGEGAICYCKENGGKKWMIESGVWVNKTYENQPPTSGGLTKVVVESVLTGTITSHNHNNQGYALQVQALTSSPTDGQTIYFGKLPKAPVTVQGTSKIYIRQAGIIKRAEIYCYSGTAGTNEAWPIYIRLNNSGDTLISSVSLATSERVFSNTGLNIAVVSGDYIEIKAINPTWVTNPLTTIFGGYIYIE